MNAQEIKELIYNPIPYETKTYMSGKLKVNVRYLNEPSDQAIENFNIEINKILHKL